MATQRRHKERKSSINGIQRKPKQRNRIPHHHVHLNKPRQRSDLQKKARLKSDEDTSARKEKKW